MHESKKMKFSASEPDDSDPLSASSTEVVPNFSIQAGQIALHVVTSLTATTISHGPANRLFASDQVVRKAQPLLYVQTAYDDAYNLAQIKTMVLGNIKLYAPSDVETYAIECEGMVDKWEVDDGPYEGFREKMEELAETVPHLISDVKSAWAWATYLRQNVNKDNGEGTFPASNWDALAPYCQQDWYRRHRLQMGVNDREHYVRVGYETCVLGEARYYDTYISEEGIASIAAGDIKTLASTTIPNTVNSED